MNKKETRRNQRFENFDKAYKLLEKYVDLADPTEIEQMGIIQAFEMSFELAWKLMKDHLEAEGFQVSSPRDTIKQAYQAGIITDGHAWIDALEARNSTVHTYDSNVADQILNQITEVYFFALQQFHQFMKKQNDIRTETER